MSEEKIFELLQINQILRKIRSDIDNVVDELINKHKISISDEKSKYSD